MKINWFIVSVIILQLGATAVYVKNGELAKGMVWFFVSIANICFLFIK